VVNFSFTLLRYQRNTIKHNILFHLYFHFTNQTPKNTIYFLIYTFTLSTKYRKTQYIFPATVHIFHSHFTTYDLRRFAAKQTGPKSIGTTVGVGSGIGSKSGKDTEVKYDSKFGTESQNWRSSSRSCSSSILLKWKLINLSMVWYWLSSIWCDEIESWLKFQDTMILGSYQSG